MKFTKLHADIDFDCLREKMEENNRDFFARKMKTDELTIKDFCSYWEEEKRPEKYNQKEVCSYKSVSINKYKDESFLIDHYRSLFRNTRRFSPKKAKAKFFCIIKFKQGAGLILDDGWSPVFHCSLFKCDQFSLDKVALLNVKEF